MRIAIDIRSLLEPFPSGVSEYTYQIVKHLFLVDQINDYFLFCNSAGGVPRFARELTKNARAHPVVRRWPNKAFNTSLFLLGHPHLDRLVGGADVFFLPNLNFFSVSRRCRLVVTIHDLSFRYPSFYPVKGRFWHRLVRPRRLLEQARMVIAVSESTKRDVQRLYGVPDKKIATIPLGIDEARFAPKNVARQEETLKKYRLTLPFMLFLGNVEQRKNIEGLLAAWELLQRRYRLRCQLVVAGSLADKNTPRRYPAVRFLGYVPEADKQDLYAAALAFAYPSYCEGFGLPVLEAMAAGLPVMASFGTSLPEVVGQAALLVDPYNTDELASAMHQIITNGSLRQKLAERGKAAAKQFSWEKAARATLEVFQQVMSY